MGFSNVGIVGVLMGLLLPLIGLMVSSAIIIAIFQIRNATRRSAEKLDAIYTLLSSAKSDSGA